MKSAPIDSLDEQATLALILGAYRADHFSNGVLETFINDGYMKKWLSRLKDIDHARKAEPEVAFLKQVKISLRPFRVGDTSELLLNGKQMVIKCNSPEGRSATHQYELGAISALGEISLAAMSDCLDAEGWQDIPFFSKTDFAINLYELEAEYDDGKTVVHSGAFDRAHIPEKLFLTFMNTVHTILQSFSFGGILDLSGFQSALKKGETKYCGVEFSEGGKIYHYRTTDLRIDVCDEVIVPVGERNDERVATVKTVDFYRWDDTPYPLEKTKSILRLICDDDDDDEASFSAPRQLTGIVTDSQDGETDDTE